MCVPPPSPVLTELVGGREGGLQPVVLHDGAAALGVAGGAHVGHAQGVARGRPTQVLGGGGTGLGGGVLEHPAPHQHPDTHGCPADPACTLRSWGHPHSWRGPRDPQKPKVSGMRFRGPASTQIPKKHPRDPTSTQKPWWAPKGSYPAPKLSGMGFGNPATTQNPTDTPGTQPASKHPKNPSYTPKSQGSHPKHPNSPGQAPGTLPAPKHLRGGTQEPSHPPPITPQPVPVAHLPREEDGGVEVEGTVLVGDVEVPLPPAEVAEHLGGVGGGGGPRGAGSQHLQARHPQLHGVAQAAVPKGPGGGRQHRQQVRPQPRAVEARHRLVRHHQHLHEARQRGETLPGSGRWARHRGGDPQWRCPPARCPQRRATTLCWGHPAPCQVTLVSRIGG